MKKEETISEESIEKFTLKNEKGVASYFLFVFGFIIFLLLSGLVLTFILNLSNRYNIIFVFPLGIALFGFVIFLIKYSLLNKELKELENGE
jgi:uncharacterized membrane protein